MDGSFYEQRPEKRYCLLPAVHDFLGEITCLWGKPYSSHFPVEGFETFTALHEAEEHELVWKSKRRLTLLCITHQQEDR